MEDEKFLEQINIKITRLTGRQVRLKLDSEDPWCMAVGFDEGESTVTIGNGALKYSGFARMCIEYAVACIRAEKEITTMEFHVLLQRN